MLVYFGYKLFGKSSRVPGMFWVSVYCFHVYGLPLWVRGTWLVPDRSLNGRWGWNDPIEIHNYRPLTLAVCIRTISFVVAVAAAFTGLIHWYQFQLSKPGPSKDTDLAILVASCILCLVSIAVHLWSWRRSNFTVATHEQALDLVKQTDLPPAVIAMVDELFDRQKRGGILSNEH